MRRIIITTLVIFSLISCIEKTTHESSNGKAEILNTEEKVTNKTIFKSPSEFFPKEKTQVLVVGTFHMDYPGLDEHKTTNEDKIDVLKDPKKAEVNELVDYIKKFNPTKIAIEAGPSWSATKKMNEYIAGKHRDSRDERFQIAMRIANELKLDTIYSVNSRALSNDWYVKDSISLGKIIGDLNWDYKNTMEGNYKEWYAYNDKMTKESNLLDYFKYMNSPESHQYGYGSYLDGWFKNENNQGADYLTIWWYNRNARIFRNIIGITESAKDRIMVLMGNGHAAILRQLIEASPEYDFVEFNSL
ncbi:hypothetical protein ULMS_22640 [Patiriisocius marinistellae]|uniref:Uncharacterized protein n=1 Tax=Patiriisocius marinistellae TaxID=2494560 RepID=A0A5J4G270_9FLAO|nr:DUF5694 domain-containing protein [Patiriisocius marinistellae]GEQ86756.1 hypothetical protein ULMS_22640 [Patiriisocius marinistellae]